MLKKPLGDESSQPRPSPRRRVQEGLKCRLPELKLDFKPNFVAVAIVSAIVLGHPFNRKVVFDWFKLHTPL